MAQDVTLSNVQAGDILASIGLHGPITVIPISEQNHVWRLQQESGAFYLKTYTKDWYGDDPAATGFCVMHEVAAWSSLRRAGLSVPVVARAEEGRDNPFGRPFLLTGELRGEPLTDILTRERTFEPLEAIGRYLGRAHDITFDYSGYITVTGPDALLREGSWQHRCWSSEQRQRDAFSTLSQTRAHLSSTVTGRLEPLLEVMVATLAAAYHPPRFVHGDCHAHQFFLCQERGVWEVSGVIDMEVSSAGDSGEDFLHLFSELATILPSATRWWEAFFAGYGRTPSFEQMRLRFLGTTPAEYLWLAGRGWPETWESIVTHFLDATTWTGLLTLPEKA